MVLQIFSFLHPNRWGLNLKAKPGFPIPLHLFISSLPGPRTLFNMEERESGQIHLQDALTVPRCGDGADVIVSVTSRSCSRKGISSNCAATVSKVKHITGLTLHEN